MPLEIRDVKLNDLMRDGCQLAENPIVFRGLMESTNNDPCTTGCAYFEGGRCLAYKKYHTNQYSGGCGPAKQPSEQEKLLGGKWQGMTAKQIMVAEGGISRNEFQRRKQAGKYLS